MLDSFFITDTSRVVAESGTYLTPLVILSYVVASIASYMALVVAQMLVETSNRRERRILHWGGAFAMGAGIWSMHFIGMLSYKMRMFIAYDPWLTSLSLVIPIMTSWGALGIVARDRLPPRRLLFSGVLMGAGICAMHYTGMAAMKMDADLRYTPGVFALSVAIAIAASVAALWMAFTLARSASRDRYIFQIGAALVMGAAICGMHYTGMASAVFIPWARCRYDPNQDFNTLAITIAAITGLIFCVALAGAAYKRVQTERKLQGSETRLRAIIESAPDAVMVMDQDGRALDWNQQAEAMFGWSAAEIMGQLLGDRIVPPQYREIHFRGLRHYLETGESNLLGRRVEMEALHRDGRIFPVELSVTVQKFGSEYQFTAFVRDISERLASEKSRGLLAAIVEFSDDAMISITLEGAVTSWNAAAQRLYGYAPEEAIGRNIGFILPEELSGEESRILENIRQGKSIEHYETQRRRKDGSRVDISLTVSPIRDGEGSVIGASKVARDISERKSAEVELMRYMKALERSNQELDDFAHIASHDMKEPLRGLVIQANFLKEDYGDKLDDQGKHRLERLTQLSQRMERLINDLLYFSQLGRAEMAVQETDLNAAVDGIRQMLEQFLKERNGHILVPKPLPTVVCDKPRVTEVLRNLITNAIKYNDKPERTAEVGFLDRVETEQGVETNVFYVRDNGVGIAPEYHNEVFRIFRRLRQPDDRETGTGAGLTFVKKIIERHMGRVWIDSVPGKGTTFYFTLGQGARPA